MKPKLKNSIMQKQKGDSLVEVLVAIAVFGIVCFAAIGFLLQVTKLPSRQEEAVRAEMLCKDIAFYGDEYGKGWVNKFDAEITAEAQSGEIMLGADFKANKNAPCYKLLYRYNEEDELVIGILHIESRRVVVEDFNYGSERYINNKNDNTLRRSK